MYPAVSHFYVQYSKPHHIIEGFDWLVVCFSINWPINETVNCVTSLEPGGIFTPTSLAFVELCHTEHVRTLASPPPIPLCYSPPRVGKERAENPPSEPTDQL